MIRSAAQYAILSRLLDEFLALDEAGRATWLAGLSVAHESQRPALTRMLTLGRATPFELLNLERQLRSSARAVRALCETEPRDAS